MGHEPRITMAKEVLRISLDKVVVDYDFRNDSDQDVTTEVAFPIPDYEFALEEVEPKSQGFDDFKLWIDGALTPCSVETRALVKGKDLTAALTALHVDVGSFAHVTVDHVFKDLERLSTSQRAQLTRTGLIDNDGVTAWTVRKKYYWRQTFPAHAIVHIRHEYTPVDGAENSIRYGLGPDPVKEETARIGSMCVEGPLRKTLVEIANSNDRDAVYFYVDFILTTANTWKGPIEDFTLIVERPHEKDVKANYVSFCWDAPVTKFDADHFEAYATNFVPKKELRVGFFEESKSSF